MTNPKLFTGGHPNQESLMSLITQFHHYKVGSKDFWDKCFLLLENLIGDDPNRTLWKKLNVDELVAIINVLSVHDKTINQVIVRENRQQRGKNELLWKKIFEEYMEALASLKFDQYQLYKTYVEISTLAAAGNQLADYVVESWCRLGFDSDELLELGPKRAVKFIETIATHCPEMSNQVFLMHIKSYAKALRQRF